MDTFKLTVGIFLALYFAAMVAISFIVRKRGNDLAGFLVARRQLPLILITISLAASVTGASMTMVATGLVYANGIAGMAFTIGPAVFMLLLGLFIAKKVRATKALTLPQIVGEMFDTKSRIASAMLVIFAEIGWVALLALATQSLLIAFLGLEPRLALGLALSVFTIYMFLGGKAADALTDAAQSLMTVVFIVILVIAGVYYHGSDPVPLSFLNPAESPLTPIQILGFFLLMGLPYLVGPDVYSIVLSAKSEAVAKRAATASAFIILGWGVIMAMLAIIGLSAVPGTKSGSSVLVKMISVLITNPILGALVVGGLIAKLMSSINTTLLTASSTISNDVIGPVLGRIKGLKEKKRERVLYISAKAGLLAIAGLSYILATQFPDMLDVLKLAYTVFVSGVILPVIAGFFKQYTRVSKLGAFMGFLAGGAVSLAWMINWKTHKGVTPDIFDSTTLINKTEGLWALSADNTALFLGLGACLAALIVGSLISLALAKKEPEGL